MQHAYKTSDLAPEERVAVERLIGRTLENDEAVELIIHKLDAMRREQQSARRKAAAARIRELSKGKSLGGARIVADRKAFTEPHEQSKSLMLTTVESSRKTKLEQR